MRGWRAKLGLLITSIVAFAAVSAGTATGATTVGETFPPSLDFGGGGGNVQRGSPQNSYVIPANGVVTSWSYQGGAFAPPPMKFKVYRRVGPNDFLTVGASQPESPSAFLLNAFDTRIPAKAGDVLGVYLSGTTPALRNVSDPQFVVSDLIGVGSDVPPGDAATWSAPIAQFQLDIAAKLEADADADGFGDETQDACPSLVTAQTECVLPETTITDHPPNRTRGRRARFEFTANEPSSFTCSVDGGPFASCASPHSFRVRKGRHSFSVRATDVNGNADATSATDAWRVKRRRR